MMNGYLRAKHLKVLLGNPDQALRMSEEENAGIVEEIMGSASRQCASSQYLAMNHYLAGKHIQVHAPPPI
jgi:hypothetical protein